MNRYTPVSSADQITTTCLVSNFNYASYVGEAIDGALRQTVPFSEIIVVDDGSTDGSLEFLKARYSRQPLVQIVGKQNAGQLSCFNEGFARATGDIVFFLDADDIYEPQYVDEALRVYDRHPSCDFLACGRQMFGNKVGVSFRYPTDRDFGYSALNTAHRREWIGASTSCLSIRRHILDEILPLPFVHDWRTRADDCLVFGASLAGAGSASWLNLWSDIASTNKIIFIAGLPISRSRIVDDWQSIGCLSISNANCVSTCSGSPQTTIASFAPLIPRRLASFWHMPASA